MQIGYVSDRFKCFYVKFFFWYNCPFHEMIVSDNTERGNLKLTRCSCRKKCMKRKIYHERNAEIQSKTCISAEVFFLLTRDQAFCLVSVFASVSSGLNPIAIQSNHLLGKSVGIKRFFSNNTYRSFLKRENTV